MPILVAIFAIALITLARPFRALALGLLLLAAGTCFGVAMLLWHFWINCRNGVLFALGRKVPHSEDEESLRIPAHFSNLSQGLDHPVPLRLPAPRRGKGPRADQAD